MIVCLAFSPSVDVTYEVEAFTLGTLSRPTAVTKVAGGKGLNVARALRRLGSTVTAVAPLGGTSGEWMAHALAADEIDLTTVAVASDTRTCIAIVSGDSPVSTDVYENSPPLSADEWAALERATAETVETGTGWIAVAGSVPAGVPLDGLVAILTAARQGGWRVAVDSHGDGLAALVHVADLVKVNVDEARGLLGDDRGGSREAEDTAAGVDAVDAAAFAAALVSRFDVDAVVTDGVRGAAVRDRSGTIRSLVSERRGRFPVGSGDSFFAGLLSGLDEGLSLADSLPRAVATGVANALIAGPAVFDRNEVTAIEAELSAPASGV